MGRVAIKKTLFGNVYNGLLLFLYIYSVSFFFFPPKIRTRMLIGGWGFFKRFGGVKIYNKYIVNTVFINIGFVLACCLTFLLTGNYAYWFTQHAMLNIVYMFGGLYIAGRFVKHKSFSYNKFLYYVLIIIMIHNIITFLGFVIKPIGTFILDLQNDTEDDFMRNVINRHIRAIGFGIGRFFVGGVTGGLAIIIACYLMSQRYISTKKGSIILMLVLITGMFIARTTIIGLIGLMLIVIRDGKFRVGLFFRFIGAIILCFGIVYGGYVLFLQDILSIDWAFELIINLINDRGVETASTNELKEMWILPDNFQTWCYGDGLFFNRDNTYYKHTDVGYLRTIYAIGLIGVGVFISLQVFLMRSIIKLKTQNNSVKALIWILALYVVIINIKGFADVNYFLYMSYGILRARSKVVEPIVQNSKYKVICNV